MVVEDAVKVLVDVVEHVNHLHGGAVVAEGGESHNVAEIDGHLLKQLWLHSAGLLQWTHHRAEETRERETVMLNDGFKLHYNCCQLYLFLGNKTRICTRKYNFAFALVAWERDEDQLGFDQENHCFES